EQACRGVRRGEAPRFNNEALPRRHRRRGRVQNPGQSERAQRVSHASRLRRKAATAAKAERELLVRVPANGAERAAKSERSAVNPGQSERAQRVSHASRLRRKAATAGQGGAGITCARARERSGASCEERAQRSESWSERTSAASEPRERSGAHGAPASKRVGGSGGAKPPGLIMKRYHDIVGDGGSRILEQVAEQRTRITDGLAGVRHLVAVGSGKGGVGKSTLTLHLAGALRARGLRIAILDADFNGPSQARMAGVQGALFVPGSHKVALPR